MHLELLEQISSFCLLGKWCCFPFAVENRTLDGEFVCIEVGLELGENASDVVKFR